MSEELLEITKLGIDAEAFMRTPVGRFLHEKAQREIDDAINQLVDADPEDMKAGRDLRNQIHVARMFQEWVGHAITAGHAAHEQMQDMDELAG